MTVHVEQTQVARRPLALVAGAAALVMLAFSGRYGFHRDELYYLVAGRHPDWGYDDQPPLVPLWAGLTGRIAGSWPDTAQLMLLRLPSVLAVAAIVVLTGVIAAEFGASRRAQTLAALAVAIAPGIMIGGHLLSTTIFDILVWTVLAWLLARWLRTRDHRLLLLLGVTAGVGLQIKSLPLIYATALIAGLLIAGPRDVFRRWQLWAGGVLAAAIWAPNVAWQATHGWPQLEMTAVIRDDADWGGRAGLLPFQALFYGFAVLLVWAPGLWRLLRSPDARTYRALGWAYVVVLVLVFATGGREYYPAGAYPPLIASGAILLDGWLARGPASRVRTVGVVAGVAWLTSLALALPVYPVTMLHATPQAAINYDAGETAGWPTFTRQVADVHRGLAERERATAVILAGNYGQAGALDHYGAAEGLPPVYSGHLAFWRWGPPPAERTGPVLLIGDGWPQTAMGEACGELTLARRLDNGLDLDNDEQGTAVWICRDLRRGWAELWPRLYHM